MIRGTRYSMLQISDAKRRKIEQYLNDGRSQNEITKLCSCGKKTVQKVKALMENGGSPTSPIMVPLTTIIHEVTLQDVDSYIKRCMLGKEKFEGSLLNTAIKLLELKNKIEPEQLKQLKEEERIEFSDTIGDAIDYLHTIRPDYQVEIPPIPGSDDKTGGVEGQ